jgi:uncharacterized protein (TIGR01777 family)
VLVSASAIGYYGDQGDRVCTEDSPPGDTFLTHVCRDWEAATQPAVVNTRIGVVLSPQGGALAKMLLPFKLCVGGKIGSGKQYWSWVSLDDLVGIFTHALTTESLRGPVNAVSPNPVTNLEFTKALGGVLGRPTIFPMPAFAARLALGEMADELLLSSARVMTTRKFIPHDYWIALLALRLLVAISRPFSPILAALLGGSWVMFVIVRCCWPHA